MSYEKIKIVAYSILRRQCSGTVKIEADINETGQNYIVDVCVQRKSNISGAYNVNTIKANCSVQLSRIYRKKTLVNLVEI